MQRMMMRSRRASQGVLIADPPVFANVEKMHDLLAA